MKAIRVLEPNVMEIQEVASPVRRAGEVRIRIERAGICGSDMAIIQGQNPFAKYPVTPGHEFSGRVAEADAGSKFQVRRPGDRAPILTCGQCDACLAGEQNHCAKLKVLGVHPRAPTRRKSWCRKSSSRSCPPACPLTWRRWPSRPRSPSTVNRRGRVKPGDNHRRHRRRRHRQPDLPGGQGQGCESSPGHRPRRATSAARPGNGRGLGHQQRPGGSGSPSPASR